MTLAHDRLQRLARAQGEMLRALEAQLAQEERKAFALSATRAELDALTSEGDSDRLALLPAALRRMADAETRLKRTLMVVDSLRRQLLSAKSRQKALTAKARLLRQALERKQVEEEALESVLAAAAKASRKHDVLS